MAEDRRQGRKVSNLYNRDNIGGTRLDTSTYIGIVKNNYDPTRSGRLQVWIPDFGGAQTETESDPGYWRTVSYASPFFGATFQPVKSLENTFENVNHTYGMWMVPPDVGNQVLCTFVNGDPNRGYWFACINPTLSHGMVPAIGSNPKTDVKTVAANSKSGLYQSLDNNPPQTFPAAEFNENDPGAIGDTFYNNPRPVHEHQAAILVKQGLDVDPIRGAITSSSQRESPSHVFGISTPGRAFGNDPADEVDFQQRLEAGLINDLDYAVRARKGGHQFVMDDGDLTGVDQLVRLRSAGGHQILMNDREKIMYIANSEGSVWVELAGSGHMHIYTAKGFNLHTEGDLNLHAGSNINMHAEKSVNIFAQTSINLDSAKININASENLLAYGGKTKIGAGANMVIGAETLQVGVDGAITIDGATVGINNGSPNNSVQGIGIEQNKLSDTGYTNETKLWREVPGAASSIVSVLPQHEPWTRAAAKYSGAEPVTGDAPFKYVGDPNCAPRTGGGTSSYKLPPPNNKNLDQGTVRGQPAPWSTDQKFLDKVKSVATALNANYIDLLACMHNETIGTMDPAVVNSSGAIGLIQFMPDTAKWLGTTTQALARLSRVDQMDWVLKYFNRSNLTSKAPTPGLRDLYLCIFWPAAVGKPDNFVIAAAGSTVVNQNKILQAPNGSITCASVSAALAQKLTIVQQILANAGVQSQAPTGVLTSSDGTPVTDGFGNPVRTGATSTTTPIDVGISDAAGKSLSGDTCPGEWLNKTDAWNPSSGIGSSKPKLTQKQVKAMMAELGYFESKWDYKKISSDGTKIGKYQEDAVYLSDSVRGYIKPDSVTQYGAADVFKHNESWTDKDNVTSTETFLDYKSVQDELQYNEFASYYAALVANGGIKLDDDVCVTAGMLFVAHYYHDPDKAKKWRDNGQDEVAANYFNHGRYAIDVLAIGGAAGGTIGALKAALNPELGTVKSANGARASVAKQYVEIFQGFINELEATGYEINSLAGYADRDVRGIPGIKSAHAYGAAIDINPANNPLGTRLITDMPVDKVRALAAKYGIGWGGNWTSRKDAMHFSMLKSEGGSASIG